MSETFKRLLAAGACALACGAASSVSAGTTNYTYDSLGRVVTVTNSNGVTTTYTYDPAGNRSVQSVNMSLPIPQPANFLVNANSSTVTLTPTILGAAAQGVTICGSPTCARPTGTVTASGTSFLYTPPSNWTGTDTFQYNAFNSAQQYSSYATVNITVHLAVGSWDQFNWDYASWQ